MTENQIDLMLSALDSYAQGVDNFQYGLPLCDDDHFSAMREIVKEMLAAAAPAQPAPEPAADAFERACQHCEAHGIAMDPEVLDGIVNAVLEPAADAGEVERDAAVLLRKYRKLCVEIGRGDSYHLSRIDAAIESIHRWAAPEAGAGGGNHG